PPPPVMMRTSSPAPMGCWVTLRTWRTAPSAAVISTPLTAPSAPPQRPHGGGASRSRLDVKNAGASSSDTRSLPRPPRGRPAPPGAARARGERVAQDAHRAEAGLDAPHRVVPRGGPAEDDHPRLAVERRARAGAAGVEVPLDEQLARLGVRAEGDGRHLVAVG